MGFSLVKTETVSLKNRGRAAALSANRANPFEPKRGDIILSNFSSWLDVLITAVKFNPIFLLPVVSPSSATPAASSSSQAKPSPARRRNAGASVVTETNAKQAQASPAADQTREKRFLGFREVSLWQALASAGKTPLIHGKDAGSYRDLATIAKEAAGPVMVFPELVTSNNRGLLRMASIFPPSWRDLYKVTGALRIGRGQSELYIMSIKHDAPTPVCSSSTLSIPTPLNPLLHIWSLCSSLSFAKGLQVRLLDPSESPTSGSYLADASVGTKGAGSSGGGEDALAEAVGGLISSLSRLKRTGLGWEDKEIFLEMYNGSGGAGRK
ncbi:hypothetical protein BCV69DRAFT_292289 [Microstroma glucosiphilum]|uniref:Uncharacterized protein n=1 Tax=Pseudomicrostroma glucosiphilum TaxID=1684307 RepID=A0A316UCH0_9BASI|nr:hypothetical protein BCV69DRAFT_292289 [Pseudomicrostroma glucosiphilum]PWN22879.1 hypothetical protein BCV69DRAFT_292289 [Pseudomicrostroma glucosiphilum]